MFTPAIWDSSKLHGFCLGEEEWKPTAAIEGLFAGICPNRFNVDVALGEGVVSELWVCPYSSHQTR